MSKRPKRRPFDVIETEKSPKPRSSVPAAGQLSSGKFVPSLGPVFAFFDQRGVRETIESIIVAVVLAMLFRTFGAEAYIIPTGSMAPTLMGQHMDVVCDHCGARYYTSSSGDNSTVPREELVHVTKTYCPYCRSPMEMRPSKDADHVSNPGDRIVVNKFIYDFSHPQRFDVIVFKYPNNGKQNFIKRLVGLPFEKITIENGDVFTLTQHGESWERTIVRKPPRKLQTMLQVVDDTDFVAPELVKANWPWRWSEWGVSNPTWDQINTDNKPIYSIKSANQNKTWLHYRHLIPTAKAWEEIEAGKTYQDLAMKDSGELISDYYGYNNFWNRRENIAFPAVDQTNPGYQWVGDLALQADLDIESDSGMIYLQLTEGGIHYEVSIDVATGEATLSNSAGYPFVNAQNDQSLAAPTAKTSIKGRGKHEIMFANCDDQLRLWVDDRLIEFGSDCYQPPRYVNPKWSPQDAGDAEPAGIAATGSDLRVTRLRLWRDIYYTSTNGESAGIDTRKETNVPGGMILKVMQDPKAWESSEGLKVFNARFREGGPMFELGEYEFLPMGDNSPESSDGRVWAGTHFVPGQLMIGRAMFVYWPHTKNKPIPYFPNFERMRPIR